MSQASLSYIKSFDGMRGIGVSFVILAHWQLAFPHLPFAWEFIQMFFILSGYLITRILLNDKEKQKEFNPFIKNFFLKRAFRIFPIYFAYIFFWLILRFLFQSDFVQYNTRELENNTWWLLTYLYNFTPVVNYFTGAPYEETNFFAHLWSLSIEEQFYLSFPFIVYLLSKKNLKIYIIISIVLGQILRVAGYPIMKAFIEDDILISRMLFRNTIFQFDAILYGSAIAVFSWEKIKNPKKWAGYLFVLLIIAYVINGYIVMTKGLTIGTGNDVIHLDKVPLAMLLRYNGIPEVLTQYGRHTYNILLINIFWFFFILSVVRGVPILPRIFESKLFVFIGKYTYGLYLYHFAILTIFLFVVKNKLGIPLDFILSNKPFQLLLFVIYFSINLLFSKWSYDYFEMYFLKLKNKIK